VLFRSSGTITIPTTGSYTFQTSTDNGGRLYIDGALVINNWANSVWTMNGTAMALTAGQRVTVVMEMWDSGGPGSAALNWQVPGASSFVAVPISAMTTPNCLIQPSSPLPALSDGTVVDGTTQTGYAGAPLVELVGSMAGTGTDGLQLTGSTSAVRGMVINGYNGCAVTLAGSGGHSLTGNFIGTTPDGNGSAANGTLGVCVRSSSNTIGSITANGRNVIGGFVTQGANTGRGIDIADGANNNVIVANHIGVGANGSSAVANASGIWMAAASGNRIGGSTAGEGNVISGNNGGPTVETGGGIVINGAATGFVIAGNTIGMAADRSTALPNTKNGIAITGGASGTVGGSTVAHRNLIASNIGHGVLVVSNGSAVVTVQNNWIGLAQDGDTARGNGGDGVVFWSGSSNGRVLDNVITASGRFNIYMLTGAHAATVQGNTIGLNSAGTTARGGQVGVQIEDSTNALIGGTTVTQRNVISGNTLNGVAIVGASTTGNTVQGNTIGLNATESAAVPNGSSDSGTTHDGGIALRSGASNNLIGGSAAGQGNVIAGNRLTGVLIRGGGTSTGNRLEGNRMGVNAAGAVIANSGFGVVIDNNDDNNTVGGTAAGAGNIIRGHTAMGVYIGGASIGNAIRGNSIYSNTRGIGLGLTATPNDGAKGNFATPNLLMDSPTLTRAVLGSNTLSVVGYVGSAALQSTFGGALVDLYVSNGGQGQTYIGTVTANADGEFAGVVSTAGVSGLVAGTTAVVATATDAGGNTSEFGNAVTTVALAPLSNGGFESGTAPGGAIVNVATGNTSTVTAWTVTGTNIDYYGTWWTPAEGARSLDLNGNARGGVAQVVQTAPGQTYTLTFALAGNSYSAPAVKGLRVTAGSTQQMLSFDTTGRTGSQMGWLDRSVTFTATSEATVLWFEGLDASDSGPALDNVRLTTGPPPAASITGTVFEDPNYGGGAGRSRANATGNSVRSGARVELFNASGNLVASATTDGSGNYSFTGLALGNYTVRVVSGSVSSSRTGWVNTLVPTVT
jgi:choice-of-anchor C domain-containing protein